MSEINVQIFQKPEWMSHDQFKKLSKSCAGVNVKNENGVVIGVIDIGQITDCGQHLIAKININDGYIKELSVIENLTTPEMFLCEFKETENQMKARELAEKYHAETENYDKTVCSAVNRVGEATPGNAQELMLININASRVKDRILKEAERFGISRSDMIKAIRKFY